MGFRAGGAQKEKAACSCPSEWGLGPSPSIREEEISLKAEPQVPWRHEKDQGPGEGRLRGKPRQSVPPHPRSNLARGHIPGRGLVTSSSEGVQLMQRALECICLQTSHVPPSINQTLPSPENLNTSANWNQQCLPA